MTIVYKNPVRFECKSFAIRLKSYEEMDKEANKLSISKIPKEPEVDLENINVRQPINLKKF